jgi:hypothetical protein
VGEGGGEALPSWAWAVTPTAQPQKIERHRPMEIRTMFIT